MTFSDWIGQSRRGLDDHGILTGTRFAATELGIGGARRLGKRINYGRPFWEKEWDVLVILDACRWDLMQEVAACWEFLPDRIPETYSPASASEEFLERHVREPYREEISETALVSANAFTRHHWVRDAGWAHLDEVWTHSWDDEEGTVLPRPVTDGAIRHWREYGQDSESPTERMIVWYLQPHAPFIEAEWSEGFERREIGDGAGVGKSVWHRYRDGELSREQLWTAYRKNLNYVLDDVDLLLSNLDADRVAITADHGNCLGEWGVYGHPKYVPVPALKRIPWVEVQARDAGTHEPDPHAERRADLSTDEVDDRLRQLGYLE